MKADKSTEKLGHICYKLSSQEAISLPFVSFIFYIIWWQFFNVNAANFIAHF